MVTQVVVDVTVTGVRWNDAGFYEGDFKYKQDLPKGKKYVDIAGNIKGKGTIEELEITLNWKSKTVKIKGVDYDAHLLHPHNKSIRLTDDFGTKPTQDAPPNNGVITVPSGNGTDTLVLKNKNNDGGIYTYNLVAWIEIDGGQRLIDDPIIINQEPPIGFMQPADPAKPAVPGDPGEPATPAQPASPAIPPDKNETD